MPSNSIIYLIPSFLHENTVETIPSYIIDAIKNCQVIFAENERTARRYLKSIYKEIVIDDYEWFTIHNTEEAQLAVFRERIKEGKNIAIISEAGCPGIADPGQILIAAAQNMNVTIKPLVGPSSVLLALMASGLNGQQFQFIGYLPIDGHQRNLKLKELEDESAKKKCTQIFIETPYRNNQMLESVLKICKPSTKICIASELTAATEFIKTKTIADWRNEKTDLHKKPVIFLLLAMPASL
ncbi:MAG: SAM-dependent methyltransferase [Chitinophagaceae bacterium]|nr:SAM-dependent methyltransferase [Chitinophagaceae bacterium]